MDGAWPSHFDALGDGGAQHAVGRAGQAADQAGGGRSGGRVFPHTQAGRKQAGMDGEMVRLAVGHRVKIDRVAPDAGRHGAPQIEPQFGTGDRRAVGQRNIDEGRAVAGLERRRGKPVNAQYGGKFGVGYRKRRAFRRTIAVENRVGAIQYHPHRPDAEFQHQFPGRAAKRCQHQRRADGGMASERHFTAGGENPYREAAGGAAWGDEGRFRQIQFLGQDLHLRGGQAGGIGEHCQRVAAEGAVGEDVGDDVAVVRHCRVSSGVGL